MAKTTNAGTVMVSTLIFLPPALLAWLALFGISLMLFLRSTLQVDAYALARSHLYGNNLEFCAPARLWQVPSLYTLSAYCSGTGQVRTHFRSHIVALPIQFQVEVRLNSNEAWGKP